MDSELKDYLEAMERRVNARFDESHGQMAEFRRDVDAQMAVFRGEVDARFEENQAQMAVFRGEVDARFEENQAQVAEFRRDVEQRFEQTDDRIRRTHVVVEDVRGLVQTVAEGVVAVRESQQRNTRELKEEIGEVRDLLTASYRYLDRRLSVVEER